MTGDGHTHRDDHVVIDAAAAYLAGLSLPQVPAGELAGLAGKLAQLSTRAQATLVAVTAEAERRGVIALSQAKNTRAWVAESAWHAKNVAWTIAKAADIAHRPELTEVWDRILATDITVPVANCVVNAYDKIRPLLGDDPGAQETVLNELLDTGAEDGIRQVDALRKEFLARYSPCDFETAEERAARQTCLTQGKLRCDTWEYGLTLDSEGRAALEAAIGPVSAPKPGPDGEPDTRPVELRRGQALIEMLRRGACAGRLRQPKTTLTLTMPYEDLKNQVGFATTTGAIGHGNKLSPKTVRRLACDAEIIPMVLGSDGEILDQGRAVRLFTPGQEANLRQRDGHCSYPGCDDPANWCDRHHLVHFADGGETNVDNGCLLCPRHHTIVHRDNLAGRLIDNKVVWDLTPGSYQHLLNQRARPPSASQGESTSEPLVRAAVEPPGLLQQSVIHRHHRSGTVVRQ